MSEMFSFINYPYRPSELMVQEWFDRPKIGKIVVDMPELRRRQSLPLDNKIQWAIERYIDYAVFLKDNGKAGSYISFSGGKDSQVCRDIIYRLHAGEMESFIRKECEYWFYYIKYIKNQPPPPCFFADTGLEFPEIRKHVAKFDNVTWDKPLQKWHEVVHVHGFLVGSKRVSRMVNDISNPTPNNEASRNLYLTGFKQDGTKTKSFKLPKRWYPLIGADFKVSQKCCDIFKKEPFHRYEAKTGLYPISGTTAEESAQRRVSYMQTGCNSFEGRIMGRPLSIWTEKNAWEYEKLTGIRFAEVYYDRGVDFMESDGQIIKVKVEGERQTGCMFCLVGPPNEIKKRFKRLEITHNKQFTFLMGPKIGIGRVFKTLKIDKHFKKDLFTPPHHETT